MFIRTPCCPDSPPNAEIQNCWPSCLEGISTPGRNFVHHRKSTKKILARLAPLSVTPCNNLPTPAYIAQCKSHLFLYKPFFTPWQSYQSISFPTSPHIIIVAWLSPPGGPASVAAREGALSEDLTVLAGGASRNGHEDNAAVIAKTELISTVADDSAVGRASVSGRRVGGGRRRSRGSGGHRGGGCGA